MYGPAFEEEQKKQDESLLGEGNLKEDGRTDALKGQPLQEQIQAVSTSGAMGNPAELAKAQQGLGGKAGALPHKAALEQRFGRSLDGIEAHTDRKAQTASRAIGANAYALGNHVGFGKENPEVETVAHEVKHVLQQTGASKGGYATSSTSHLEAEADAGAGGAVSQSPVGLMKDPTKLLTDSQVMSAIAYNGRRGYAKEIIKQIQEKVGSDPTGTLDKEGVIAIAEWQKSKGLSVDGKVGPNTLRKLDVKQQEEEKEEEKKEKSGTFDDESVAKMKDYYVDNATGSSPDPCIVAMNKGLRQLYGERVKVGSTVQDTMAHMQKGGMVSSKQVIEFLDEKGRVTTGVREPKTLSQSASGYLLDMCKGDAGWHVFGMSMMDGYHSITVTVDTRVPSEPKIYWSDQWSSHGGFKAHSPTEFDEKLQDLTNKWWNGYKREKGYPPRSRLTFWKLQTKGA